MKITRSQLRRLIREEYRHVNYLQEAEGGAVSKAGKRLKDAGGWKGLHVQHTGRRGWKGDVNQDILDALNQLWGILTFSSKGIDYGKVDKPSARESVILTPSVQKFVRYTSMKARSQGGEAESLRDATDSMEDWLDARGASSSTLSALKRALKALTSLVLREAGPALKKWQQS